jgi:hypothetical protein
MPDAIEYTVLALDAMGVIYQDGDAAIGDLRTSMSSNGCSGSEPVSTP